MISRIMNSRAVCRLLGHDRELEIVREQGKARTKSRLDTQQWVISESQQMWAADWLAEVMDDEAAAKELNGAVESALKLQGGRGGS